MKLWNLVFLALVIAGCSVSNNDSTNVVGTNTAGGTGDDTGGTQNVEVDFFEVTVEEIPEVSFFASKDGARATGCRYDPDTSASAYIRCVVDVDELDGFNNAWTLINTAPGDVCAYRGFRSYYYSIANVDNAPDYVSYEEDTESGEVSNVFYYYDVVPDPSDSTPTANGTTIRVPPPGMLIASADDVLCPYDYSNRGEGKNCCKGQYTPLVFDPDNLATPGNFLEAKEWGGDPKNCFHGPAMEDSLPKASNGFPAYFYTKVEGAGFRDTYSIASPNEKRDSQVYLANYYDPTVHAANDQSVAGETNVPVAIQPGIGYGFPFYRYDCLDANSEIVARIDVQFREWNIKSQIAVAGGAGDPDQRGSESSPFGAQCNNDFFDWDDLVPDNSLADTCYPGMTFFTDDNWLEGRFIIEEW